MNLKKRQFSGICKVRINGILFFLISIYSLNSFAWGWGKYNLYDCPNQESAEACNTLCKKDNVQLEFKLNQQKNFVMALLYEGGKSAGSSTYDNCKIIDAENWSCERDSKLSMVRIAMKDGLFERKMLDLTGRLSNFYSCAKR